MNDRLKSALMDRYRLEGELGQGGMATVYLAEDVKHRRKVAVKVLKPELASSIGPDRFLREIRTTANLRHPHIVPLYDSGEADGFLFYVMPYVEGESLEERMTREGPLPVDEALRLTSDVVGALRYAHERGVIHRDIKPGNIMIEAGHAIVADFGIASALEVAGGTNLTRTGTFLGTPMYMSPEQANSPDQIDPRSDLYSLACVLYEMLGGVPPFSGPTLAVVLVRHMLDPVPPLGTLRPGLPPHIPAAVERALAKIPADRFATAEDWIQALTVASTPGTHPGAETVAAPTADGTGRGIAVLPFGAPASSPDLTALAEGLTEDVATGLARFPYLTVVGAGPDVPDDPAEAGRALGVRYLLKARLRGSGPTVRLNLQLIDARSGAQIWGENYDRQMGSDTVFEVQDALTDEIVATVGDYAGVLVRSMGAELRALPDERLTTDDWVMRAVGYMQVHHPPEEHASIRAALEAAVAAEPHHAEAHAWLANMYRIEVTFGYNPGPDPMGRSLRAAQRAVDLDPTSQAGWTDVAAAQFFLGDLPRFEVAAKRAIALNPRNTFTAAWMGMLIGHTGQWERGAALARTACALNPHHLEWYLFPIFYHHYDRGEYDQAFVVARKINWPQLPYSDVNIAASCGQLGRMDEARASLESLRTVHRLDMNGLRAAYTQWRIPDTLIDHLLDGLRKAGFEQEPD